MPRRKSDQLDAMVGAKVRVFRINRGISQTALAEKLGVTFQQVQKYEKGANRIGASRLSQIATALDISIAELFEPSREKKAADIDSPFKLLAEPGAFACAEGLRSDLRSGRAACDRQSDRRHRQP